MTKKILKTNENGRKNKNLVYYYTTDQWSWSFGHTTTVKFYDVSALLKLQQIFFFE